MYGYEALAVNTYHPDKLPPLPEWEDQSVQVAYEVLCDLAEPPDGEHWEGFVARRIVAALRNAEQAQVLRAMADLRRQSEEMYRLQKDVKRYRWLRKAGAWESEIGMDCLSAKPEEFDKAVDAAIRAGDKAD